jgi:Gnt-I system low-affinity gluconate transporter
MGLVLFPLVLVGLRSIGGNFVAKEGAVYPWLQLIGHPFIAILAACLLAFYGLAVRRGMSRGKVLEICASALQPAGIILLVTGAGGVFKQVLVDSGVGGLLGDALIGLGLPIALAAFVISATVRVIQGSALVACLTTIGLILPIIETMHFSGAKLAALCVCIAGGSIVLSHVNDSGFWLFGKFTGATELQTLKTWTVMETILGTTGAAIGMLAFCVVP